MIIIKIIILYFIQIRHTDDFPSTGTRLVGIMQFACQEHRFRPGNVVGIKHKHGAHINQACL